jgi:hypothetical protein
MLPMSDANISKPSAPIPMVNSTSQRYKLGVRLPAKVLICCKRQARHGIHSSQCHNIFEGILTQVGQNQDLVEARITVVKNTPSITVVKLT